MMRAVWIGWLVFVLLASSLLFIPSGVKAENDPPQPPEGGTVYFSGPWNITDTREYTNCTIIADGNITVKSGGNLILRNVTLKMNCSSDKKWKIDVWAGGEMHILDWDNDNTTSYDASVITTNNTSYRFIFLVRDGATFEMRNSELHRCGGGVGVWVIDPPAPNPAYYGLYIETDNATIDHNLISYNNDGIVLYGSDATISNNTITWNDQAGIFATVYSNGTIENNTITWNKEYGLWITGSSGFYGSNPLVINNVITDTGRGSNTANGISVETGSAPIIKNTVVLRSTEDAMGSVSSTPTLINVTLDGGNVGISTSTSGTVKFINSTIRNTNGADVSAADNHVYLINSSFNESKIHAENSGDIYVQWYLNVLVQDSSNSPIPDANVRIKDNENGTYDQNFTTNNDGYVRWIVLTEYWENSTTNISYTPYNITVNYTGLTFNNNPRDTNMNTSRTEVFTANEAVPEFNSIIFPLIFVIFVSVSFLRERRKTCK